MQVLKNNTFVCIKLVIQFTGILPRIVNTLLQNIDFVIGYLHWMFLGIVSLGLIGFLHLFKLLKLTKTTLIFYVFGFIFTQILIFYRGFVSLFNLKEINYFNGCLLVASCLFLNVILYIFLLQFIYKKQKID